MENENKFTIKCNNDDSDNVIAVREKVSVDIDIKERSIHLHDFTYSIDEIIAVADKLKAMGLDKELTFS